MSAVFLAIVAMITIVALGLIAAPLFRGGEAAPTESAGDALRQRLAAIARDRDSGLIGAEASMEAEIEAKRAALAATAPEPAPGAAKTWRFAAIAFIAAAPLAAAGLYSLVGAPALIDPPLAPSAADIASLPEAERRAMIESMVAGLAKRLEERPEDFEGWRMLARSQMALERPAEAAASYRQLLDATDGDVEDWRNYATALAAAAPGQQFPSDREFLRAIGEIEKRAPGDMMALFYRGGAARQAGDAAGAAALWRRLLEAMPEDAPVRSTLEELIAEAEIAALNKPVPK
jgi:cytochrome c-type biogenesis protein CcmH